MIVAPAIKTEGKYFQLAGNERVTRRKVSPEFYAIIGVGASLAGLMVGLAGLMLYLISQVNRRIDRLEDRVDRLEAGLDRLAERFAESIEQLREQVHFTRQARDVGWSGCSRPSLETGRNRPDNDEG